MDDDSDVDPVRLPPALFVVVGLVLQLILCTIKLRQSRLEPAADVNEGM